MATREELLTALRNAHNAGDTAAAQRIAEMISAMPQAEAAQPAGPVASPLQDRQQLPEWFNAPAHAQPQQGRSQLPDFVDDSAINAPGEMLYENVVGRGAVDTPGERLGEMVRGAGAATARGMADVPALPANVAQLAAAGVDYGLNAAGAIDGPSAISRALNSLPDTRDMLSWTTGGESDYVAPGRVGRAISTGFEFAGGAGGLSSIMGQGARHTANTALRYGLVPGLASEGAGQLTEGTAYEPYVRIATALATPTALQAATNVVRRAFSPTGGADPLRLAAAKRMRDAGVNVTAGQASRRPGVMNLEGTLDPLDSQIDDFTAAAMRSIGSDALRATDDALVASRTRIVDAMDDAIRGVDVIPNPTQGAQAVAAADRYRTMTPNAVSAIPKIAGEIRTIATSNSPVSLTQLNRWRSDIGALTASSDNYTREAAHMLRELIDEMTDTALRAANRTDDIQALATARAQYRNFLAVQDTATRAGSEGVRTLSPTALHQAVLRTQGRSSTATGRGTDLARLTEDAAATLRAAPKVLGNGMRNANPALLGTAIGGAAGYAGGNPMNAAIGAAMGALAPRMASMAAGTPLGQGYLGNQFFGANSPVFRSEQFTSQIPGILSNQSQNDKRAFIARLLAQQGGQR